MRGRRPVRADYDHFRQLVEALPLIAWIADPRGEVSYFNQAWTTFTGLPLEVSVGQGYQVALHPDDLPRAGELWARSLETGEPFENVHRFRSWDGEYRWQLARAVPYRGEDGQIDRWIGTCTDIDDQRRANDAARFLASASSELAEAHDPHQMFARIAALAIPGFADWAAVDLVGEGGDIRRVSLAHGDEGRLAIALELERAFPPPRRPVAQVLESGQPVWSANLTPEQLASTAVNDEHLRWLQLLGPRSFLCVPIELAGRRVAAITFVFSESGRRYRELDLTTAVDLARRTTVALDNARLYEELRASDRKKSEFLALLAHELRNPLAPLRTGVEMLSEGPADPSPTVRIIERQLGQIERLVDDLLDIDRISRGALRVQLDPVPLAEVLAAAVETSEPHLRRGGHTLVRSGDADSVVVSGDSARLTQVFGNLLNNAARYTAPRGTITLAVLPGDGCVEVQVRDTGIGLRPDDLDRVFDLFVRAGPGAAGWDGGLGIGLTLVRRLVEQHGGTISAHSEGPNRGSTFVVRLPAAIRPTEPLAPAPAEPAAAPVVALRILLADDNREAADLLASALALLGHELHVVYDGEAAWHRAAEIRPDVALLDIGMPGMDGRALARRIRHEPWGTQMVLIALTGWGHTEDRDASALAGFDHHVTKPVKRATLRDLLLRVGARPVP